MDTALIVDEILAELGEGPPVLSGSGEPSEEEIMEEVYYSPQGFLGASALVDVIKRKTGRVIPLAKVRKFLSQQGIHQITTRKNKVLTHHYNIREPHKLHEADLLYLDITGETRYLLGIIDAYSRYLVVVPMKGRTERDMLAALKIAYGKDSPFPPPKVFSSDGGSEFNNSLVHKFFDEHNVQHRIRRKGKHARLIERVFLTIQRPLYRYRDVHLKKDWTKIVDEVIEGYNNRTHSTLGVSPYEALTSETEIVSKVPALPESDRHEPRFKIGDRVRIAYPVEGKRRAVDFTFSDDWYNISRVHHWSSDEDGVLDGKIHPNYYELQGIPGSQFHEDEIIDANIVNKPIEVEKWYRAFGEAKKKRVGTANKRIPARAGRRV